jgi:hypothetical protein
MLTVLELLSEKVCLAGSKQKMRMSFACKKLKRKKIS